MRVRHDQAAHSDEGNPEAWLDDLESDGIRVAVLAAARAWRWLGRIRLRKDPEGESPISDLGFDAHHELPRLREIRRRLEGCRGNAKGLVMDQRFAAGVTQVVARLLDLLGPSAAVFGEKDWQQLQLVRAMVRDAAAATPDRWPHLEILAGATVREPDGLAMSSRNRLLSEEARHAARGIPRALQLAHSAQHPPTAERLMRETLEAHGLEVEYAVVRDAETLLPIGDFRSPTRGLIAARVGGVRLIDNQPMTIWQ